MSMYHYLGASATDDKKGSLSAAIAIEQGRTDSEDHGAFETVSRPMSHMLSRGTDTSTKSESKGDSWLTRKVVGPIPGWGVVVGAVVLVGLLLSGAAALSARALIRRVA